jgi:DNA gyrase inhibitor GyrI
VVVKEQAYIQFCEQSKNNPLGLAADLMVGAYLMTKTADTAAMVPTSETLHAALTAPLTLQEQGTVHSATVAAAHAACQQAQVLHWPLAFPQVFATGGFDCVLGNPPWERIKLQEEEFFATRHPAVAAAKNKAERSQRIQWLSEGMLSQHLYPTDNAHHTPAESTAEQRLYDEFIVTRRVAEAASVFMHVDGVDGGRYPLTGVGDVNTYALFSETILQITAPSGRAGFIVPTGIATDDSTKAFFGHIVSHKRLAKLLSLYEIRAWFKATDDRKSFCLLTLGESESAEFLFDAKTVVDFGKLQKWFKLTPDEFRLINPNTLTSPVFRSARDAELTKKLYRTVPVLIREAVWQGTGKGAKLIVPEVNPWGISFSRMLDMANDSHLFKITLAPDRLPLFEAKLIHQFDHRWATYTPSGDTRDMTLAEKQDPHSCVTPRYWVDQREVWLRLTRLPDGLRKAMRDRNEAATVLGVIQLLFGHWLAARFKTEGSASSNFPSLRVYPAWLAFVQQYPFAQQVAPVSLGLCGDNPPCLKPLDDNYLPAQGSFEVEMSNERASTAWYAVDPQALEKMLVFTAQHSYLLEPTQALQSAQDVLDLAERWLEMSCPKWLMGWRDIALRSVERTVIGSVLPLAGVNHKTPLWFANAAPSILHVVALRANLDALVLDYVARQKIGGSSLTYFYLKQFPILPPDRYTETDLAFIVPRVLELTFTAHDLSGWAQDLGYNGPPFAFDPERRAVLRAELDACYARLYSLTRDELRYILDPADVMGADYPSETFRVLKNGELREFGEYRTQRLVMREFDRMALAEANGEQFSSLLNPPPGEQAQPAYSSHGIVQDEVDAHLVGLVLTMIRQLGRLPRRHLTDAMAMAGKPGSWPQHFDAQGVGAMNAFQLRSPGVFDAQRLNGARLQTWLRHFESTGVIRMESQTDVLVAVPAAVLPSYVLADEETTRLASLLTQTVSLAVASNAADEEKPVGVSVKRA